MIIKNKFTFIIIISIIISSIIIIIIIKGPMSTSFACIALRRWPANIVKKHAKDLSWEEKGVMISVGHRRKRIQIYMLKLAI